MSSLPIQDRPRRGQDPDSCREAVAFLPGMLAREEGGRMKDRFCHCKEYAATIRELKEEVSLWKIRADEAEKVWQEKDVEIDRLKSLLAGFASNDERLLLADENERLKARVSELEGCLSQIESLQPKALDRFRKDGIIFDKSPISKADKWQDVAFWLYTDLCEANSLCRNVVEDKLPEAT